MGIASQIALPLFQKCCIEARKRIESIIASENLPRNLQFLSLLERPTLSGEFHCFYLAIFKLMSVRFQTFAYNSSIDVARIFYWGEGPNHKSYAMTSSEIFKKGTFCRAKIS